MGPRCWTQILYSTLSQMMSHLSSPQEKRYVWLFCFVRQGLSIQAWLVTIYSLYRPDQSQTYADQPACAFWVLVWRGMFCNKPLLITLMGTAASHRVSGGAETRLPTDLSRSSWTPSEKMWSVNISKTLILILSFQDSAFFESKLMAKGLHFYRTRHLCLTHFIYTPILALILLCFI